MTYIVQMRLFYRTTALATHLCVEVSHTQRVKKLAKVADDCILGSSAVARAEVGIDAKNDARATVQLWRPVIVKKGGESWLRTKEIVSDVNPSFLHTPVRLFDTNSPVICG